MVVSNQRDCERARPCEVGSFSLVISECGGTPNFERPQGSEDATRVTGNVLGASFTGRSGLLVAYASRLPPGGQAQGSEIRSLRARSVARLFVPVVALLATLCVAEPSVAAPPAVYHSPADDGIAPGAPVVIPDLVQTTLFLYIDAGTNASLADPCHQGSGDEICWWDLTLEGRDGLGLVSFIGSAGVVSNLTPSSLVFNGGDVNGTLGPTKIGELVVDGNAGGLLVLLPGQIVSSALNIAPVAQSALVTIPEPGQTGLFAGVAWLWALRHRAQRRLKS